MRSFFVLSTLTGLAAAAGGINYPNATQVVASLESVYGPRTPIGNVVAWHNRTPSSRAISPVYFSNRRSDDCTFPLEVFIVQDITASFTDNFEEMKKEQLQRMYDALKKDHPHSTYGVGAFRDKPIWSLGDPKSDYCFKVIQPLSESYDDLYNAYDRISSTGGGDPPETQFEAIIAAAESSKSGWSDPLATRVIVVSTDSQPHYKDDGLNDKYHLKDYTGHYDEENPDQQCREQYYPTPEMVKEAVSKLQAYVIVAVFDGDYPQPTKPIDDWRYFSSLIGEPDAFVVNVKSDTTDFWDRIAEAIRAIEEAECPEPTTTAAPTTTYPPTTAAPTTTYPPTTAAPTTTYPPTTAAPTTTYPPTTAAPTIATTAALECECPPEAEGPCGCPAVKIVLQEKPKHLRLEVDNEDGTDEADR